MLIRKSHPDFQKNKFNGIGGNVEDKHYHLKQLSDTANNIKRESHYYKKLEMIREFKEETKSDLELDWQHFGYLYRNPHDYSDAPKNFSIHCFYAIYEGSFYDLGLYDQSNIKSLEQLDPYTDEVDEDVYIINISQLNNIQMVEYTRALIYLIMEKINNNLDYPSISIEIGI